MLFRSLSSAPSAFQKIMSTILAGIKGVQCYLDDIIVFGKTAQVHDETLSVVLERISNAGLQLNIEKCQIGKNTLKFLGYTLSSKDIEPNEEFVEAIIKTPCPSNVHELRSFLGLASFYSKFVPNFATVVEPICMLSRKGNDFVWTQKANKSFELVKKIIVDSNAISVFDPACKTVATTDASDCGLEAVLTQVDELGTEHTVAFAS